MEIKFVSGFEGFATTADWYCIPFKTALFFCLGAEAL